ncbi:MAG: phytanoyl-CoA dioxygenase family protein [Alphaproteobacteria bacterium]
MGAVVDMARFRRDGYLRLKNLFTAGEMAAFNRGADECQAARERGESIGEDLLSNRHLRRIMLDDRILAVARSLIGGKPIYFGDGQFVVHKPTSNVGTYHKDNVDRLDNNGPDWRSEYNLVRFGVYLEPHDGTSGGLLAQAGSHKNVARSRVVEVLKEEVVRPLTFRARYMGLPLGDVVVWNLRLTHAGMGRYIRLAPFIPVTERNGGFLPEALKSTPVSGQRRAVFFTLGAAGPHMDRYVAYLKTRGYQVETWKNSPYGDSERTAAGGKDIEVRDMHAEVLADIAASRPVGQSRKWQPQPY